MRRAESTIFVAEMLTKHDERLEAIEEKLDGERKSLLMDVHAFVSEDHAIVKDLLRRVERLEQRVGIAA
jgi:hypothetical protein